MTSKSIPFFDKAHDNPTEYDGLLGWSADWKCYIDQVNKPVVLDDIWSLDPDEESVTVQKGDTLGKIAKEHYCTVDELAALNHIKNPALIYPGQVLKIPTKQYAYSEPNKEPEDKSEGASDDDQSVISLLFEDLIEKPIPGLKVKIRSTLNDVYETVTDGLGKIEEFVAQVEDELTVSVISATGKEKEIGVIKTWPGKANIIFSSPKARVKGKSAAVKGPAGDAEDNKGQINTVNEGRDAKGAPIVQINHVCPNNYDLALNKNNLYWSEIVAASERSGIIPQSIAAVINAESAKLSSGIWNPDSVCIGSRDPETKKIKYRSSAAGMTQFLNGTWMGETFREGTYLHEKAIEKGIIASHPLLDKKGNVRKNKNGEIIYGMKFQATADVWLSLNELVDKGYLSGETPYPRHATEAIQSWLNTRFVPEYAIMAAVDYGLANLSALKEAGYNIDGLNDAEKAKIIYLTHHLGLGDAKKFIKNEIVEDKAKKLLIRQVKAGPAAKKHAVWGSYIEAHRNWLIGYIDQRIKINEYYCQELTTGQMHEKTALKNIMEKI